MQQITFETQLVNASMLDEPRGDREPESEMAYSPPVAEDAEDDEYDSHSDGADGLFSRVPDEVCETIFKHLDAASFFRLSYTCSRFFKVCIQHSRHHEAIFSL